MLQAKVPVIVWVAGGFAAGGTFVTLAANLSRMRQHGSALSQSAAAAGHHGHARRR
jgi:hypothetical protein